MPFDVNKLLAFCTTEIRRFAADHRGEVFYAFAIDANLLCLNSEQEFARTLKRYQDNWDRKTRRIEKWEDLTNHDLRDVEFLLELEAEYSGLDRRDKTACLAVINANRILERERGNSYQSPEEIKSLRENTGDWKYQGFADMSGIDGFDTRAYAAHYDMSDEGQQTSAYGIAMDALVDRLSKAGAFDCLQTTADFYAVRVEHNY